MPHLHGKVEIDPRGSIWENTECYTQETHAQGSAGLPESRCYCRVSQGVEVIFSSLIHPDHHSLLLVGASRPRAVRNRSNGMRLAWVSRSDIFTFVEVWSDVHSSGPLSQAMRVRQRSAQNRTLRARIRWLLDCHCVALDRIPPSCHPLEPQASRKLLTYPGIARDSRTTDRPPM